MAFHLSVFRPSAENPDGKDLLQWMGRKGANSLPPQAGASGEHTQPPAVENRPIEPESRSLFSGGALKWFLFLVFVFYALIAQYHESVLKMMGGYLVVSDEPRRVELVAITPGSPCEKALTAADWYKKGLAKMIFVGRAPLSEGAEELRRNGAPVQEERDQILGWLQALDVPLSACLLQDDPLRSGSEEAVMLKRIALENDFRLVAIVTSPVESRRVAYHCSTSLKEAGIESLIIPSRYSTFQKDNWWQSPRWREAVLTEYVRLILAKTTGSP